MKVTVQEGGTFKLLAECQADEDLVGALDVERFAIVTTVAREKRERGYVSNECQLTPGKRVSVGHALGEVASAFSDLLALTLRQSADNGHVIADAAHPQTHEAIATGIVKLQLMLQTFGAQIRQQHGIQVVGSTHNTFSRVDRAMVADEGHGLTVATDAAQALLRRAQTGQHAGTTNLQFWKGYEKALQDFMSGCGAKLAAKDAPHAVREAARRSA